VEAIFEASTPTQAAAYCKDPAKRHPEYRDFLFEKGETTLINLKAISPHHLLAGEPVNELTLLQPRPSLTTESRRKNSQQTLGSSQLLLNTNASSAITTLPELR